MKGLVEEVELKCEDKISTQCKRKEAEIGELKQLVNILVNKTQQGFAKSGEKFRLLEKKVANGVGAGANGSQLGLLADRVKKLEQDAAKLKGADGVAVAFNNLGFTSRRESDAWLELNAPKDQFGFVVDFHTVMEHIHQQINGVDSLSSLGKLYKLKIKTMSEGVAMTSFETNSPRFLTLSGAHTVVDTEASYFSHIQSFAKWNDPLEGFKKRWKRELSVFRTAHAETLQTHLSPTSEVYFVALASLTESVAWVLGFINYIDETYSQYANGKFGVKKSWHITTKLATALINDIGTPRRGAMNSFKAGDGQHINQTIFYAVVRSLDKMALIQSQNYKGAPAVSTELVKFLSMNTSVEAVDKLIEQGAEFKTNFSDI